MLNRVRKEGDFTEFFSYLHCLHHSFPAINCCTIWFGKESVLEIKCDQWCCRNLHYSVINSAHAFCIHFFLYVCVFAQWVVLNGKISVQKFVTTVEEKKLCKHLFVLSFS